MDKLISTTLWTPGEKDEVLFRRLIIIFSILFTFFAVVTIAFDFKRAMNLDVLSERVKRLLYEKNKISPEVAFRQIEKSKLLKELQREKVEKEMIFKPEVFKQTFSKEQMQASFGKLRDAFKFKDIDFKKSIQKLEKQEGTGKWGISKPDARHAEVLQELGSQQLDAGVGAVDVGAIGLSGVGSGEKISVHGADDFLAVIEFGEMSLDDRSHVGKLRREDVLKVISANQTHIRGCYERYLRLFPTLSGTVSIEFNVVTDSGQVVVSKARILKNQMNLSQAGDKLGACLTQLALQWRFQDPGGETIIQFPFVFQAKESL